MTPHYLPPLKYFSLGETVDVYHTVHKFDGARFFSYALVLHTLIII